MEYVEISRLGTNVPRKSPENHHKKSPENHQKNQQKSSKSKCVDHTEQESPQEIPRKSSEKSAKVIKKQVCRSYRTGIK
jgi:hypothetical protein